MVKPKQKHTRPALGKKQNQKTREANPNPLFDDGDWMVVKKQRITILIPPLPSKVQSKMPNVQEKPTKTISESSKQSIHEIEKSVSSTPEPHIHATKTLHPCEPNFVTRKPRSLVHRKKTPRNHSFFRDGNSKKGMMIFGDSISVFLNQRMRASWLEKKLKKAGGLENWLVSLGLARFVKVFQRKRVNKFQLANLSMKKLKDMGADAVGPRRKLMHAIDCLCQPHCFQHL